jgi:hypothetical protein
LTGTVPRSSARNRLWWSRLMKARLHRSSAHICRLARSCRTGPFADAPTAASRLQSGPRQAGRSENRRCLARYDPRSCPKCPRRGRRRGDRNRHEGAPTGAASSFSQIVEAGAARKTGRKRPHALVIPRVVPPLPGCGRRVSRE